LSYERLLGLPGGFYSPRCLARTTLHEPRPGVKSGFEARVAGPGGGVSALRRCAGWRGSGRVRLLPGGFSLAIGVARSRQGGRSGPVGIRCHICGHRRTCVHHLPIVISAGPPAGQRQVVNGNVNSHLMDFYQFPGPSA